MIDKLKQVLGMLLRKNDDKSTFIELKHGEVILGHSFESTVVIDDPTVSVRHTRIYTHLSVSYIEGLNSSNGTFVNDKRVKNHVLKPGDVIRLAKYLLIVDNKRYGYNNSASGQFTKP